MLLSSILPLIVLIYIYIYIKGLGRFLFGSNVSNFYLKILMYYEGQVMA
jgi:hypothetical protein